MTAASPAELTEDTKHVEKTQVHMKAERRDEQRRWSTSNIKKTLCAGKEKFELMSKTHSNLKDKATHNASVQRTVLYVLP